MSDSYQPQYSPAPPTNTMAIVSLVSGLVGWFAIPLLGAVVAIITGHMARGEIRNSRGLQRGDGLAIVGLILGYLNLAASCILPILIFAGVISIGGLCSICTLISEPGSFEMSAAAIPPLP